MTLTDAVMTRALVDTINLGHDLTDDAAADALERHLTTIAGLITGRQDIADILSAFTDATGHLVATFARIGTAKVNPSAGPAARDVAELVVAAANGLDDEHTTLVDTLMADVDTLIERDTFAGAARARDLVGYAVAALARLARDHDVHADIDHANPDGYLTWHGPRPITPSPDCDAGKHTACVGAAWDYTLDELTACPCPCHGGES